MTDSDKLMTPREVAAYLAIGLRSLQRHTARGDIPRPVRFGRTLRYSRRALDRWVDRHTQVGSA